MNIDYSKDFPNAPLIAECYAYILDEKKSEPAKNIVFEIVHDFTDRRGLRQEWEQIDDDVKNKILEIWIGITKKFIPLP